jgi:hypothetical protein
MGINPSPTYPRNLIGSDSYAPNSLRPGAPIATSRDVHEYRRLVAQGIDPSVQRQTERAA